MVEVVVAMVARVVAVQNMLMVLVGGGDVKDGCGNGNRNGDGSGDIHDFFFIFIKLKLYFIMFF